MGLASCPRVPQDGHSHHGSLAVWCCRPPTLPISGDSLHFDGAGGAKLPNASLTAAGAELGELSCLLASLGLSVPGGTACVDTRARCHRVEPPTPTPAGTGRSWGPACPLPTPSALTA